MTNSIPSAWSLLSIAPPRLPKVREEVLRLFASGRAASGMECLLSLHRITVAVARAMRSGCIVRF